MVENVDEKIGAVSEKIQHISINKMPPKNLRVHEMPTGPPKVDNCPRTTKQNYHNILYSCTWFCTCREKEE